MTPEVQARQREYRVNAHLRWCECGQRAFKRSAGAFVCVRCWELQQIYCNTNIVDFRLPTPAAQGRQGVLELESRPGPGWGSLEWLERKLEQKQTE